MPISGKIADDLKMALKKGDKNRLSVLRMIKSAMKNLEIEKRADLEDSEVQTLLLSCVKRAKESMDQFSKAGRTDLADKEKAELSVIQEYLPQQLGEEELRRVVKDVVDEQGASGPKDFGNVMKAAMAKLRGQADGKLVNTIVKETLEA